MSGSFQPPGAAYDAHWSFWWMLYMTLFHSSEMSCVVRQLLPTAGAHVAGSSWPHSHMEKKICRPLALSASRIGG